MPHNNIMDELFGGAKWYSRAGRITAPGIKIPMQSKTTGSSSTAGGFFRKLDYSKLVTEDDLDDEEERPAAAPVADGSMLCSSPRQHPNAVSTRLLLVTAEKEAHFLNALQIVVDEEEVTVEKTGRVSSPVEEAARLRKRDHKKVRPNASFLAVARDKVNTTRLLQGPPVGHYRPRFQAVEEALHIPKISRKHHSPRPKRYGAATPPPPATPPVPLALSPSSAQYSSGVVPPQTALSDTLHSSPSLGNTLTAKPAAAPPVDPATLPKPSWPFASKTKGHELQLNVAYSTTPSTPFINTRLVDNFAGSKLTCFMGKHVGRQDKPTTINDLQYMPAPLKAKTPTVYMDRQPPRDRPEHMPRVSTDVPRGQIAIDLETEERTKYRRPPSVLLDKGTSRQNEWLAYRSPTKDTYENTLASAASGSSDLMDGSGGPSATPVAGRTIDLRRNIRNRAKAASALDLVYNVDRAVLDKHVPTALIKEDLFPSMQGQEPANQASELRSYSVDFVHKKVIHNVSISNMATREQHSKSGRVAPPHLLEAQQKFYDTGAGGNQVPGSPKIALHVSRDKRAQVTLPAHQFVDTVYDYSPEAGKKSSGGMGNVSFDRVLDREHRAPSRADL